MGDERLAQKYGQSPTFVVNISVSCN